jgi:hypothetical protein
LTHLNEEFLYCKLFQNDLRFFSRISRLPSMGTSLSSLSWINGKMGAIKCQLSLNHFTIDGNVLLAALGGGSIPATDATIMPILRNSLRVTPELNIACKIWNSSVKNHSVTAIVAIIGTRVGFRVGGGRGCLDRAGVARGSEVVVETHHRFGVATKKHPESGDKRSLVFERV